jgi:hypothetical protein
MPFTKLSKDEAETYGILYSTKIDPESGELRARLSSCGMDVTITRVPEAARGGWQSSHRHERVVERTSIIEGEAIEAEQLHSGEIAFRLYRAGDSFETHPGLAHSLFVKPGTVMSTLKLNDDPVHHDWFADLELDTQVCGLSWEVALTRVR